MDDLKIPEELQKELNKLRKRDKIYAWIFSSLVVIALFGGVWLYQHDHPSVISLKKDNQSFPAYNTVSFNYVAPFGIKALNDPGCCQKTYDYKDGRKISVPLLEQQITYKYKADYKYDQGITAKATDFGCHIQVDLFDSSNKLLKSYSYRDGQIYIIKQ